MVTWKEHEVLSPSLSILDTVYWVFWYLKAEKIICAAAYDLNGWKTVFQIRCLLLFVFTLLNDKTPPDSCNVLKTNENFTQLSNLALICEELALNWVISSYFQALLHRGETVMAGLFLPMDGVCIWLKCGCVRSYLCNIEIFGRASHWYGNRQWATLSRQNK